MQGVEQLPDAAAAAQLASGLERVEEAGEGGLTLAHFG